MLSQIQRTFPDMMHPRSCVVKLYTDLSFFHHLLIMRNVSSPPCEVRCIRA
jgi:hypothetical protein